MAKKKTKKTQEGDFPKSVANVDEPPPANGEQQLVMEFGAAISAPVAGDFVTLKWGSAADGFELIAAVTSEGRHTWNRKSFDGDGVKHLRVTISNNDKLKPFFVWLDGVQREVL